MGCDRRRDLDAGDSDELAASSVGECDPHSFGAVGCQHRAAERERFEQDEGETFVSGG